MIDNKICKLPSNKLNKKCAGLWERKLTTLLNQFSDKRRLEKGVK